LLPALVIRYYFVPLHKGPYYYLSFCSPPQLANHRKAVLTLIEMFNLKSSMGRSQETFSKKENAKKRQQKKREKEQRREEKRQAAASNKGKSLDDMLAYVDEYGNITTTPPDPKKLKPVSADEIMISTPKLEDIEDAGGMRTGRVAFYNESKGYGFINDGMTGERIFFHVNDLTEPIAEDDRIEFNIVKGQRGPQAADIKKIS